MDPFRISAAPGRRMFGDEARKLIAIHLNAKVSSHRPILKRLERLERLEPVGLTGAAVKNRFSCAN